MGPIGRLRKHLLGVETAITAYARERDGDVELPRRITGLVHDLDYERFPDSTTP